MSLTLRQTQTTAQRLDLSGILPEHLQGMDATAIRNLPLYVGNQRLALGAVFALEGEPDDGLVLIPLDGWLDHIGAEMRRGRIRVMGAAGHYAGRAMHGGELVIDGDAGDFAGSGLRGERLRILGDAGNRVGAPPAGKRQGQRAGLEASRVFVRGEDDRVNVSLREDVGASRQRTGRGSSGPSSPPKRMGWAWAWRSAAASPRPTGFAHPSTGGTGQRLSPQPAVSQRGPMKDRHISPETVNAAAVYIVDH